MLNLGQLCNIKYSNHLKKFGLIGLIILFPMNSHAQKFYKWVDSKGSTHYTTTPPPKNSKKVGSINTYNDLPSGSIPTQSNTTPTQSNPAEQQNAPAENNSKPTTGTEYIPLPPKQSDLLRDQPEPTRL